ncbi:hypothetical protein [Leptospira borgpetersenii]|uniref:hypothetical protein n=1 Tax=Leptospira borgpetersenii TaxID=174 RepID=UPI000380140C|nr:hypothetical protein [Leptospira borgpetersenii]MBE8222409.1 hypothetical protein [Leptospira borgpetersenii serovar Ballum]MBE8292073.1 hypothetical protein [Leptospira borgpetersenii serovar Ballum]
MKSTAVRAYNRRNGANQIGVQTFRPEYVSRRIFKQFSKYDRYQCFGDSAWIDFTSRNFLLTSNSVNFATDPNYTNRNRPINALVNGPTGVKD